MTDKPASLRPQFILFLCAVGCMAAAGGVNDSIFNNFLKDTFALSPKARGLLELPRELPGFLVVAMAGVLAALPVTRLGGVGALGIIVGMVGLAFLGTTYHIMVLMMMLASAGQHLIMPVSDSIALAMGNETNRGKRMGQMGAVSTLGTILGTGFVWLFFSRATPQYHTGFLIAAGIAAVAGLLFMRMHIPHLHQPRSKLVFRRKYLLYYVLELLYGARKQIFLTFGPWVLITVYHRPASSIASLLMIAAFIGIVFKPFVGWAIDRFGERKIMITDGVLLIFVCLGYGYAKAITGNEKTALLIASVCYIADNLLFTLSAARAIYLSRLTDSPQEITSTLAMGVSVNHAASMIIPLVIGMIWMHFSYRTVFAAAAVLALIVAVCSYLVPARRPAVATPE